MPEWRITQTIQSQFGENYLADADLLLFFSGENLNREDLKKKGQIYKIVNAALARDANGMTEGDLKMVELTQAKQPEPVSVQEPEQNDAAEASTDNTDSEENNANTDGADTAADNSNGDVIADTLSESVESPTPNEKFVFCKITLK